MGIEKGTDPDPILGLDLITKNKEVGEKHESV
jgi:hypothetical protein